MKTYVSTLHVFLVFSRATIRCGSGRLSKHTTFLNSHSFVEMCDCMGAMCVHCVVQNTLTIFAGCSNNYLTFEIQSSPSKIASYETLVSTIFEISIANYSDEMCVEYSKLCTYYYSITFLITSPIIPFHVPSDLLLP